MCRESQWIVIEKSHPNPKMIPKSVDPLGLDVSDPVSRGRRSPPPPDLASCMVASRRKFIPEIFLPVRIFVIVIDTNYTLYCVAYVKDARRFFRLINFCLHTLSLPPFSTPERNSSFPEPVSFQFFF